MYFYGYFIKMAKTLLMVSPDHFGFNNETAQSNAFQKNIEGDQIQQSAMKEFENAVETIRNKGIEVITFPSPKNTICPDAVFPNNWFSTHSDGKLIIYPMLTPNRRAERNPEIIHYLENNFTISQKIDLSNLEANGIILEGTGSLVFDPISKLAYACVSPRTDEETVHHVCSMLGYSALLFEAKDLNGKSIYHTNVVMAIGKNFVVICLESIDDLLERHLIKESLKLTGKKIIEIDFSQMNSFAGNMLEVENKTGKSYLILSETALNSLKKDQIDSLKEFSELLPISIPTIETIGGGSARCMLAEILLETKIP